MAPNYIPGRDTLPLSDLVLRQEGASSSTASTGSAPASSQAQIVGLAIGCVIGGIILLAIIVILVVLRIRRRRHRQAIAELQQSTLPVVVPSTEYTSEKSDVARYNGLKSLRAGTGWDFLASTETVNEPAQVAHSNKRKRSQFFQKRPETPAGIPAQAEPKHLSAIQETLESPRSLHCSHNLDLYSNQGRIDEVMGTSPDAGVAQPKGRAIVLQDSGNVFTAPGSPKPEAVPSLALKSPATYNPLFPRPDPKFGGAIRSVSLGVLRVDTSGAVLANTDRLSRQISEMKRPRPAMHARSASLGAPLSRPPSGPIPPLPVISPLSLQDISRQAVCIPRVPSAGSINSTGSSILVTSPILARKDSDQPLSSPTVEQLVAENDDAALKTVSNGQWQQPRPQGPARVSTNPNMALQTGRSRASVRANLVRSSTDSTLINRMSTSSFSSTDSMDRNRLSIPIVATADRVSISRVSSSNSLVGSAGVQKIVTPRKTRRLSSVSAQGSPAEKNRRSAILKDISGNAQHCNVRKRNVSISTQNSGSSSNGNPFHWDNNTAKIVSKPSALKGSPNARKGHRRQNCVRISTLTPQVLGPSSSRSRSSSPAGIVMDEITEERESDEIKREVQKERREIERAVAQERRRSTLPRPPLPPRQSSSESCLRIQTLRASLTPSSPTLSNWNSYHDANTVGLASHPSDCALSTRPDSRQSDCSSVTGPFTIPRFPSPARTSVALTRTLPEFDTAPMPDLSFDLESPTLGFEEKNSSSPFTLAMSSDDEASPVSPRKSQDSAEISPVSSADLPSSPPLPNSKSYDPNWPAVVHIPPPTEGNEYDPASPPVIWDEESDMQRSSLFLPFANLEDFQLDAFSVKSRPSSYVLPESPPQSPKTVLKEDKKLTSENASSIMAGMPSSTSTSSFLGTSIPSLLPSNADNNDAFYLPRYEPVQAPRESPQRQPFVAVAPSLPTILQSDDHDFPAPAPLNIKPVKHVPQGPRSAPAKSVLKNAMALRRMNSEVSKEIAAMTQNRESRNYVRLGREASPLLPWCPNTPKSDGSANDGIFDFDFDGNASAGATERTSRHGVPLVDSPKYKTMDEIDLSSYEHSVSAGFILPAAEKPAPLQLKYTGDPRPTSRSREHISPRSLKYSQQQAARESMRQSPGSIYSQPTPTKMPAGTTSQQKRTSVWDDGEKFWSSPNTNQQKHESFNLSPAIKRMTMASRESAGSLNLPQFSQATPDGRRTPTMMRLRQGAEQVEAGATPRSLYDSDGFLKA